VLPFLEQKSLQDRITPGIPIESAPDFLLRHPRIFYCPIRGARDGSIASTMDPSHYVFVPHDRQQSFHVFDAPLAVKVPWASGPEMTYADVVRQIGPHERGFFYASGFQNGVGFMLEGGDIQ
jgi:hypothetical protein